MALTPATLEVVPEHIAAGGVWIAPGVDGEIAGVVALAPGDAPDTLNLNKLFVEPRDIGSGIGQGPGPRKSSCATIFCYFVDPRKTTAFGASPLAAPSRWLAASSDHGRGNRIQESDQARFCGPPVASHTTGTARKTRAKITCRARRLPCANC
jgi:hypothetical protein